MKKIVSQGFTIIELLVVVSVIGLLSSIGLAQLQQARDKAQVAANQQFHSSVQSSLGASQVASWEFDEGNGNIAVDISGNGHDGTIVGATYVEGINGTALYFDGNDYVEGLDIEATDNQPLTFTAWVNPSNIVGPQTIFIQGGGECVGYAVGINGGKPTAKNNTKSKVTTNDRNVASNKWTHYAMVYNSDGSVVTYINGTKVGQTNDLPVTECVASSWTIAANSAEDFIGLEDEGGGAGGNFVGTIDSVRIYDEAFTVAQVEKLYAESLKTINLTER